LSRQSIAALPEPVDVSVFAPWDWIVTIDPPRIDTGAGEVMCALEKMSVTVPD
jgi:hypothetical protein